MADPLRLDLINENNNNHHRHGRRNVAMLDEKCTGAWYVIVELSADLKKKINKINALHTSTHALSFKCLMSHTRARMEKRISLGFS